MNRIFADSFFFFALLNPRDEAHERAVDFSRQNSGPLITTHWVLVEVADGLARTARRGLFLQLLRDLDANQLNRVVLYGDDLWRAGIELYDARPDKHWSLTDCLSFAIMEREGITDALTGDHHFEQAGFRALLK